jgi:hypothetical protein
MHIVWVVIAGGVWQARLAKSRPVPARWGPSFSVDGESTPNGNRRTGS